MEQYFVWNADPVLLTLGSVSIHWYGVLFAAALGLGFVTMQAIYRREGKDQAGLDPLLVYLTAGTLIGARLGHVLFYDPAYYFANPLQIFALWKGGLASHGGALGIVLGLWLYCRRHPETGYLWLLDRISIPALLGGGLIRIGNFFNSEIAGLPTAVPWAVIFPHIDRLPRHPTQLYEALSYLLLFAVFCLIYRTSRAGERRGLLTGLFLVLVFTARFVLEFTKMQQENYQQFSTLSMGQWLSIPAVLAGAAMIYRACANSGRGMNRAVV